MDPLEDAYNGGNPEPSGQEPPPVLWPWLGVALVVVIMVLALL
jgi:hypothetical protein